MLKAAGITAEYNPLHNGHIYHIEETRRITGCDAVVVAMSGDYVQRGEPAFMDKWVRAGQALQCGADLVVEIPALFCLGNAGQYAAAAVKILEATGKVTHISFGSESGDAGSLIRIAETMRDNGQRIAEHIKSVRTPGLSYPAARALAYSEVRAEIKGSDAETDPEILQDKQIFSSSNDILAIEYIRAMRRAEPVVIKRQGAGYRAPFDDSMDHQSASAIRSMIFEGRDVSEYVPECTAASFVENHLTGPDRDRWFDALRYAVLSTDIAEIEDCPSGGEGLASLMKEKAMTAGSWTEFVRSVKSRRYTYTRISRLCMQLVLGISRTAYDIDSPGYIRVLGFNDTGRALLAEIRDEESSELPVIINVNKGAADLDERSAGLLRLDMHAADIYNLMTKGEIGPHSDHVKAPVIIQK